MCPNSRICYIQINKGMAMAEVLIYLLFVCNHRVLILKSFIVNPDFN